MFLLFPSQVFLTQFHSFLQLFVHDLPAVLWLWATGPGVLVSGQTALLKLSSRLHRSLLYFLVILQPDVFVCGVIILIPTKSFHTSHK